MSHSGPDTKSKKLRKISRMGVVSSEYEAMRARFISEFCLGQAISTIWYMSEQRRCSVWTTGGSWFDSRQGQENSSLLRNFHNISGAQSAS
jgi:hypothetical protein